MSDENSGSVITAEIEARMKSSAEAPNDLGALERAAWAVGYNDAVIAMAARSDSELVAYIRRQWAWSKDTFGPALRTKGVVEHIRKAVADDSIRIDVVESGEPSPVSPMDAPFELIEACIEDVFPEAVATPYVMMAATDSRHFTAISEHVYRFAPFRMSKAQRQAIHSYDEHIGVADLVAGARWYALLIERLP